MGRRELTSSKSLWDRHIKLYYEVFSMALLDLADVDPISGDEDELSEQLCLCLNNTCFKIGKIRNQEVPTPNWEGPIQPVTQDELKGGKIKKRPDFSCKCVNPLADSLKNYEISLHVECKRLGNPTSPSWVLNENYVTNGIKRFDSKNHEYGKRAQTGMMVGYITNMNPKSILAEVNKYQKKYLPENSAISFKLNQSLLIKTSQKIDRKYIKPFKFELIHLWIDITQHYH